MDELVRQRFAPSLLLSRLMAFCGPEMPDRVEAVNLRWLGDPLLLAPAIRVGMVYNRIDVLRMAGRYSTFPVPYWIHRWGEHA